MDYMRNFVALSAIILCVFFFGCTRQCAGTHLVYETSDKTARLSTKETFSGDCRLDATFPQAGGADGVKIFFAASDALSDRVYWLLRSDYLQLYRVKSGVEKQLKDEPFKPGPAPWEISLLKRGSYYILHINGIHAATVTYPSGDIEYGGAGVSGHEPVAAKVGLEWTKGKWKVKNPKLNIGTWCPELPTKPVMTWGRTKWTQGQIFPGAILEIDNATPYRDKDGYYYMYVNGSDVGERKEESGGVLRIGVAKSKDLVNWELANNGEFVLEGTEGTWDETTIMANGAVIAPDERIAISYMGWSGNRHKWGGVGLAFGDNPEGPFVKYGEPVLPLGEKTEWDGLVMHEHYLTKIDGQYVCFYTGGNWRVPYNGKRMGDKIGVAYSDDLINWRRDNGNPVMVPMGKEPSGSRKWDSDHIRARDVRKIGDMYYLLYEGASGERNRIGMKRHTWDSVGLARSSSLTGPWERHPLNPIICQQTGDAFDSIWTGWPRSVIKDGKVYIYYSAGPKEFGLNPHRASLGLRIVPLERFISWQAEFTAVGDE